MKKKVVVMVLLVAFACYGCEGVDSDESSNKNVETYKAYVVCWNCCEGQYIDIEKGKLVKVVVNYVGLEGVVKCDNCGTFSLTATGTPLPRSINGREAAVRMVLDRHYGNEKIENKQSGHGLIYALLLLPLLL